MVAREAAELAAAGAADLQPDLVADAVLYAAEHRRRSIFLAWPTVEAVIGEKLAPAFVDRYLAKHGYVGAAWLAVVAGASGLRLARR